MSSYTRCCNGANNNSYATKCIPGVWEALSDAKPVVEGTIFEPRLPREGVRELFETALYALCLGYCFVILRGGLGRLVGPLSCPREDGRLAPHLHSVVRLATSTTRMLTAPAVRQAPPC